MHALVLRMEWYLHAGWGSAWMLPSGWRTCVWDCLLAPRTARPIACMLGRCSSLELEVLAAAIGTGKVPVIWGYVRAVCHTSHGASTQSFLSHGCTSLFLT
jgi:hypothetical protein